MTIKSPSLNGLTQLGFRLVIPRCEDVAWNVQEVAPPSLSLSPVQQSTPWRPINLPQGHLSMGDLQIEFLISENMTGYRTLRQWLVDLGSIDGFENYSRISKEGLSSRIDLYIEDSKHNINLKYIFEDAFPVYLSAPIFRSDSEQVHYLSAQASFRFSTFDLNNV